MKLNQRTLLIIGGALFGLLVLVSSFFFYQQSQMGKMITTTIPNDALVTLDGKQVNANGSTLINPGKHTIKAQRNGFKDQSQDFTINSGENKAIQIYMTADGDVGHQWLIDHPDQATQIEGYYGQQYDKAANNLYNNNLIMQQLPVIDNTFRIDYGASKKGGQFALYIQISDDQGKKDALDWMSVNGFDPTKYEIYFDNVETGQETPN